MNIARMSVDRPVAVTMMALIVMLVGGVSLWRLPIDLLPEVDFPTITVATEYENASPEEMELLVTKVIEEAVAAVPGVDTLTSVSAEGQSNVRVSFTWGTNLDAATNDIRDRLDRIINRLPDEANRPQVRKFDVAGFPIVIMGVGSELSPLELRRVVDDRIRYRLEQMPGVAAVDIWGGLQREVRIDLDADRIKALQLPPDRVITALRDANVTAPAGELEQGQYEIGLRTPGEFTDLDQVRQTVVDDRDGAPIYLHQVAQVVDTHRKITRLIRINGEPGVRLAVRKQSGSNTVEVANRVIAEIARINEDLPQIRVIPVIDSSTYIRQAIRNVGTSVMLGGSLAIFVLLLFLRNVRSTLVIATAIPVSVVATFSLIYFGGFTLNLMTLGGLALGVGMMVDNSIVVLENIYRRQGRTSDTKAAAAKGAMEVAPAIVASTLTTLVIFLPLAFVQGVSGMLFKQLAYVICFALICSLFVALTVVPMLSALILKPGANVGGGGVGRWLFNTTGTFLDALDTLYLKLLRTVLAHRFLTMLFVLAVAVASLSLAPKIGTELMPATDEGEVRVNAEMEVGTRLDVVDRQMRKIESIIEKNVPEMRSWAVSLGPSGFRPGGSAEGDVRISLVPGPERNRTSEQIAADLRTKLSNIPGVTVRTRAPQGMFLLNRLVGGDEAMQIEVRGFDLQVLDALVVEIQRAIDDIPGITDIRVSREAGSPQRIFRINRERAADLGLSVRQVAGLVEVAIAGRQAGAYRDGGDEYRIMVRLADAERLDYDDILDLMVTNRHGVPIALRNVVEIDPRLGPIQIERKNQQRVARVSANISGRDLGSVVRDAQEQLRQIPTPSGYEILIAGDFEAQQEAFVELLVTLVMSLLLVYMVMACLYESLRDPMVVMFSVPLAGIGVLVMLYLTDTTFNMQSFIGCTMLGGIVVNNAILIVDQAARLRTEKGMIVMDAVAEAGRRRLRPILMTTLTTVLGLLPLALGWGEGADAQAPMARAVVGGLLGSTLITLVVIPIAYTLFHPEKRRQPDEMPSALPATA